MDDTLNPPGLPILEYPVTIHSFQCDPARRLSIPALFGIFGEAAHHDATRRGWGYEALLNRNEAWVLIRMIVEISRMPTWEERVVLRTWPKTMEGVVAYRDFQLVDRQGQALAAGSSAWSLVDLEKRRPLRMSSINPAPGVMTYPDAVGLKTNKIAWPSGLLTRETITAKYSHIDMNMHVNNARYIEWVVNEIPMEVLLERRISQISLNFLSEVKPGVAVEVRTPEKEADDCLYSGFVTFKETGQPAFASTFRFHPTF
ncbi:MAG: thioesterase [Bacteroidales bacterium]